MYGAIDAEEEIEPQSEIEPEMAQGMAGRPVRGPRGQVELSRGGDALGAAAGSRKCLQSCPHYVAWVTGDIGDDAADEEPSEVVYNKILLFD